MKDVTIVIVCFDRYGPLKACLRSIRRFYPTVKIIVSDNGRMTNVAGLAAKWNCTHLDLPYDSGANFARQEGQRAVKTKYWVIGEDDFIFTKDTLLPNFKTILDHDREIDLIGGLAIRGNRLGTIGSTFRIDRKRETFFREPLRKPEFRTVETIPYYLCDFVRMFFMARRDIPIDWEVGEYVGSGTHISIALKNYMDKKYQMAFTHSVAVSHVQAHETPEYKLMRSRVRKQMCLLHRDTGLRYGVFDGKRVRDYKDQVSITMEEWRKRTSK